MIHPNTILKKYQNIFKKFPVVQTIFMEIVFDLTRNYNNVVIIGTVKNWINGELLSDGRRPMEMEEGLHYLLQYLTNGYTVLMISKTQLYESSGNPQYTVYFQKPDIVFNPDPSIPYELQVMEYIRNQPHNILMFSTVTI